MLFTRAISADQVRYARQSGSRHIDTDLGDALGGPLTDSSAGGEAVAKGHDLLDVGLEIGDGGFEVYDRCDPESGDEKGVLFLEPAVQRLTSSGTCS